MPQSAASSYSPSTSVLRWEAAGELLADTLSGYLKSCLSLESYPLDNLNSTNCKNLALRIDLSLDSLHARLSRELAQSRVALAKTRNKIVSSCYSLPNEILAEIFLNVVYAPAPNDRPNLPMDRVLRQMYARLHGVLSVCAVWRHIGMELRGLWPVVPLGGRRSKCPSALATTLSLERSRASPNQDRNIHLAVLSYMKHCSDLLVMERRIPQFRTLNLQTDSTYSMTRFFNELLARGPLHNLSEMSIYRQQEERWDHLGNPRLPQPVDDVTHAMRTRDVFMDLLRTVAVLRVRGICIGWEKVHFSNRLVELRLQSVVFGQDTQLVDLLQALDAASELRDLKLISVITLHDSTVSLPLLLGKLSFPNLKSLLLEDLNFTTLKLVLSSVAPGSHQLQLFLTDNCRKIHIPDTTPEEANIEEIYGLLRRVVVDTLILKGHGVLSHWLNHTELHGLLKTLPALKTLKMAYWDLTEDHLIALKRPRARKKGASQSFPCIHNLYLLDVQIYETMTLKNLVNSHSVQRMGFSGIIIKDISADDEANSQEDDFEEFTEGAPIVKWLRQNVPQFRLVRNLSEDMDFEQEVWRLW
ncbi:unnamed protein product [Rhizoctonia solani]|uniref:Uncharacterized protein n=2 Tax=Rhizoctonia solani TaxID=456999 RepID=A0A8H3CFF5_9AGAM|nr:unnamed protein product [Rhizoctonia solani]